jgi:hypothetical protein
MTFASVKIKNTFRLARRGDYLFSSRALAATVALIFRTAIEISTYPAAANRTLFGNATRNSRDADAMGRID